MALVFLVVNVILSWLCRCTNCHSGSGRGSGRRLCGGEKGDDFGQHHRQHSRIAVVVKVVIHSHLRRMGECLLERPHQ